MTNCSTENSGGGAGWPRRSREAKAERLPLLLIPLLLLATGCHRDQVKVYHVANDQNQMSAQAAPALPPGSSATALPPGHPDISSVPMAATPLPSEPAPAPLTWTTPAGWTEVPPSEMRVASFKASGANGKLADVSIVPLPGMAGTDEANVNRWRGQVGLSAVSADDVQKSAENIVAGDQPAQLYDIAGKNPASGDASRILAVIQHRDGMAWFYKMTGDADLVEQQKPVFVEFLKSLKFAAAQPSGSPGEIPATLPPGHPAIGDMTTPAAASTPVSHEGQPNWQVPAGWQEVPAAQFLLAEYSIAGADGAKAEVNVAELNGTGGGLAANVNRWRGQIGLTPLSADDLNQSLTTVAVTGGSAQLVDMSGTDARTGQPTRLVGVIVSQPGQTWFYKLMGDAKVVAGQKDAFTQFVQSAKYPDAH